ncbi:MAG: Bor family protein [Minwuiales bacterium]|nr:Bor family protein [Minwuiales bacterium]
MTCQFGPAALRRRLLPVLLLAGVMAVQGCATYQVRTPDSDPLEQTYQSEAPQAFFWGLVQDPQVVSADCDGGLNDVVLKRTYLHDLASVLTLGIWMPTAVEYRCRAPRGDGGSFPEAKD